MIISPVELGLVDRRCEESVIRAMLDDNSVAIELAEMGELTGEHFYDVRMGLVYDSIMELTKGIEPVDYQAIVREVNRRRGQRPSIDDGYLDSIQGVPGRWKGYSARVTRLYRLRHASEFAAYLLTALQEKQQLDDIADELAEFVDEIISKPSKTDGWVWGGDTLDAARQFMEQRIQEAKENRNTEFSWPWGSWNERILPLRKGMVGIIAAPDGMGKSLYLECIAEHWASIGKQVAFVHLEDNLEYKLDRRLARWANVPLHAIESGIIPEFQKEKISKAENRIASFAGNLHYYHAPGESMVNIVNLLTQKHKQGLVDVVVFDYIDKVAPSRGQVSTYGTNPWERQANDMEQLKTMAERLEIPVITATQGNKEMQGDGMQTRKAIQGSGQKSQKAQLVVILTREILDAPMVDETNRVIAEEGDYSPQVTVRIDKQNRGRTGSFQQMLLGAQFRVKDGIFGKVEL